MAEYATSHAIARRNRVPSIRRQSRIPRLVFWVCRRMLTGVPHGSVRLTFPDGQSAAFGQTNSGPQAHIRIRSAAILWRSLLRGAIGFGDAYCDGAWDSDNLADIFRFFVLNRRFLHARDRRFFKVRKHDRHFHRKRVNSLPGSRRNIEEHYDLGNAFYAAWLDETMTYSSALFAGGAERSLAEAQRVKYDSILDRLEAKPGDRILEIGCGWGGFIEAATSRGIHVTGITISKRQLAFAQERLARLGRSHLADIRDQDYRKVTGQYDHIVSIEMIEAVGHEHWPDYFDRVQACLRPGGKALIQAITIHAEIYEQYRTQPDFIQRYIFPGGMLPTKAIMVDQSERAGLHCETCMTFAKDYARTLMEWRSRFHASWDKIEPLGFDARFRRLWHYYLTYCAVGFASGTIDVGHYCLTRTDL